MTKQYKFHDDAAIDYLLMQIYTLDKWDQIQLEIYEQKLKSILIMLANNDDDITPYYQVYRQGNYPPFIICGFHKIYFIRSNFLLQIRRIIHVNADINLQLFN